MEKIVRKIKEDILEPGDIVRLKGDDSNLARIDRILPLGSIILNKPLDNHYLFRNTDKLILVKKGEKQ